MNRAHYNTNTGKQFVIFHYIYFKNNERAASGTETLGGTEQYSKFKIKQQQNNDFRETKKPPTHFRETTQMLHNPRNID